jgi:hypothetical protein
MNSLCSRGNRQNWKTLRGIAAPLILAAGLLATQSSAQPQAQKSDHGVLAYVFDPDSQDAAVWRFETGKPEVKDLFRVPDANETSLSPDGRWFVNFFKRAYGRTGAPGKTLPLAPEGSYGSGVFSADSTRLVYSMWGLTGWSLGVLELEPGRVTGFQGALVHSHDAAGEKNPLPPIGMYDVPAPVAWLDSTHVVVTGITPFSDAPTDSLFVLDLGKPAASAPSPVKPLWEDLPAYAQTRFSPDMKKLAFTSADPTRTPACFGAFTAPHNTLSIVDLATSRVTSTPAPSDQCIWNLQWPPDSSRVVLEVGTDVLESSEHTSFVRRTSSRLMSVDAVSGAVFSGPALPTDNAESGSDLLVCGSTVYFGIYAQHGAKIFAAPLASLGPTATVAEIDRMAVLKSCAP